MREELIDIFIMSNLTQQINNPAQIMELLRNLLLSILFHNLPKVNFNFPHYRHNQTLHNRIQQHRLFLILLNNVTKSLLKFQKRKLLEFIRT